MKSKKGITLIALIITIIVMLILVGVTINVAINGGLFKNAKESAKKQEQQAIYEQIVGFSVWTNDGEINIPATVDAIEKSELNVKSKDPSEITEDTTEVILTIAGKYGDYRYKITTREISIVEDGLTETDLEHLKALLEGDTISMTAGEGNVYVNNNPTSMADYIVFNYPGETIKCVDVGEIITIQYKNNYYDIELDTSGNNVTIKNVSQSDYTPPLADKDDFFTIEIIDESKNEIAITGFTQSGKTKITSQYNGQLTIPGTLVGTDDKTYKVVEIAEGAFDYDNNILSLVIDANSELNSIGSQAFKRCNSLSSVTINGKNPIAIGEHAFEICTGLTTLQMGKISEIKEGAFSECSNLSGELVIPSTLQTIAKRAFYYTGIEKLTLPDGNLEEIGEEAFYRCESLSGTLTIPESVTTIETFAFGDTGIKTLVLPEGNLTKLGSGAFISCESLSGTITIPSTLETIEESAFSRTGIEHIVFSGNKLKTIGDSAFRECTHLTGTLTIPANVEKIARVAFYQTGIEELVLQGNNLKNIEPAAFQYCENLKGELTIPLSIEMIGKDSFKNTQLSKIYVKNSFTTNATGYGGWAPDGAEIMPLD